MSKEEAVAYVFSQSVAALITLEACKAFNAERIVQGYSPGYDENALLQIINDHGISHNAVMALFEAART